MGEEKINAAKNEDFILIGTNEIEEKDEEVNENTKEENISTLTCQENYTLQVSVKTKETLLGRKLHQNDETDWKMDVHCVQKDIIPDIIEGHNINTDKKLSTEVGTDLCLSPSWMRKKDYNTNTPLSIEKNQSTETSVDKTEIMQKSQDEDD